MTIISDTKVFANVFPEVRTAIYMELTKNFFVFQFPFMKKLLDAHVDIVFNLAIKKAFTPGKTHTDETTWEEDISGLVGDYYYRIYPCEDSQVAKVCFPEVFAFVEEKFYAQKHNFFDGSFDDDIGVCVTLLMRITRTVYKARGWWRNPEKVAKVFNRWFD